MNNQAILNSREQFANELWLSGRASLEATSSVTIGAGPKRLPVQFGSEFAQLTREVCPPVKPCQTDTFEFLLADVLTRFVNLPVEDVDREIHDALRRVRDFWDLDEAELWRNSRDGSSLVLTHHCPAACALFSPAKSLASRGPEGNGSHKLPRRQDVMTPGLESQGRYPWLTGAAKRGKTVAFSKLADLPRDAVRDKQSFVERGVCSGVFIPFLVFGEVVGAVSFEMLAAEQTWSDQLIRRLELVAEVFAQATVRKLSEEKLRAKEIQLTQAAASAGAALWSLDLNTRRFQTTANAYELLGVLPGADLTFEGFLQLVHPEDRERVQKAAEETIRTRGKIDIEFRVALAGDGIYWLSSRGRYEQETPGVPARLMGASVDITEKKKAQEELVRALAEIKQLKDRLLAESEYLKAEIKVTHAHGQIIGCSRVIKRVLHDVEQVAPAECPVLITGETGTGKELIAQELHRLSARKDRVMVLVNCAALPAALVESELFGRERGAYTGAMTSQVGRFEVANGSTIFLDEVGELSMEVQAKLLRVLQQGEFQRLGSPKTQKVDVRVLAATNRDLAEEVRKGRFREDLYYRLKVFPVDLPALRERTEDIPLLAFAFMEEFATRMGKKITKIPRKAMETLQGHAWPGNIRELRNVIEHSVILTIGDTLKLTLLGDSPSREAKPVTLAEAEREHILRTLESTGWRIKGPHGAATRLDLEPSTLYSRMQKLGIPHRRQKDEMATLG